MYQSPEKWQKVPNTKDLDVNITEGEEEPSTAEEDPSTATVTLTTEITNGSTFSTWKELVEVTMPEQDGAAELNPSASDYMDAEIVLLRKIQQESFGEDIARLKKDATIGCCIQCLT